MQILGMHESLEDKVGLIDTDGMIRGLHQSTGAGLVSIAHTLSGNGLCGGKG
jgi:hypothetical protein